MMRTLFHVILIFVLFVIANSCGKDALNPELTNPETIDHTKDFLKKLKVDRSDRTSAYSIHGEFDGKLIYFSVDHYSADDTGWNTHYVDQSIGLDQINLIRHDQTHSVQIALYFQQTNIFNRQLPHVVPSGGFEFVEIELINLHKIRNAVQGSPEDDFTFWETTSKALKIEVSSVTDNTLEGTFEGYIRSNTGSRIEVKNGHFRIKIKIADMSIQ